MKQITIIFLGIISAMLMGSMFMSVSDGEEDIPVMSEVKTPKAFQVGVYSSLDNAKNEANNKNGVISYENELYYVYIAILSEEINIAKMKDYLDRNNIYYYVKDINLEEGVKNKMYEYEQLMLETTSDIALMQLNSKILESYGGYSES